MKKKTITMTTILILIIVLGFSMKLYKHQETSPISPEKEDNTPNVTNSNDPSIAEDSINEKPRTPAEELSKEFTKAIQSTINFFSGNFTHIVAIGDSLTQGVGDSTGQGGYVGILNKHINHNEKVASFENLGKGGNRTAHLIKRIEDPNIRKSLKNADIILITIGANDIMHVVKENFTDITYDLFTQERVRYEERIRSIFSNLSNLNPDASIYLIGFYNPFQQYFDHIKELDMIVDDWNNTGKQVAEDYGATFIPTKDLFINQDANLFAEDHFHPNEYGYQLMAERIANYLAVD
jgi:lysophospholipase L1-like esterase